MRIKLALLKANIGEKNMHGCELTTMLCLLVMKRQVLEVLVSYVI